MLPIDAFHSAGPASLWHARRGRRGWLQAGPPGVDDHVVDEAGVDGVMQAEGDDTVVVRVARRGGGCAPHGPERIGERLPGGWPGAGRAGRPGREGPRLDSRHVT